MDSETKEISKIDRHCAFCHTLIPAEEVKCCGKCHRRAFCSRKCQVADWTPKSSQTGPKKGQGHKNWCGLLSGEEDLDWKVVSVTKYKKGVPSQERGLLATKFIPKNSRIMIEGFGGGNKNKALPDERTITKVLDRSLLTNHACNANAIKTPDPTFMAMIIYAKKDINEGDEIFTNYLCFNENYAYRPMDPSSSDSYKKPKNIMSFEDSRKMLEARYEIQCPPNCFCYNSSDVEQLVIKSKEVCATWLWVPGQKSTVKEADKLLMVMEWIIEHHDVIEGCPLQKAALLEKGFHVAAQRSSTMDKAKEYIQEAYQIFSSIFHPESFLPIRAKKLMDEPESAPSYLGLDSIRKRIKRTSGKS